MRKKIESFIMPAWVMFDEDLTPNAKLVYSLLVTFCIVRFNSNHCRVKNKYLTETFNVSLCTINKSLKLLKKRFHIEIETINNNERTISILDFKKIKKQWEALFNCGDK